MEFQVADPMEGHKSRIEGQQFFCGEEDRRLLLPVGANPLRRGFSLDKRKGYGSKLVEIEVAVFRVVWLWLHQAAKSRRKKE